MHYVGAIVGFAAILGYTDFFRKLLKVDFGHALPFTLSMILSLYFIASIIYVLDITIYSSFILTCRDIAFCFSWNRCLGLGGIHTYACGLTGPEASGHSLLTIFHKRPCDVPENDTLGIGP